MTEISKTIISRIQNRRGLKQDLPQPLRPGELGFATDTLQLYIGVDPEEFNEYNKISSVENITGAATALNSIAANQLITFTVPYMTTTVASSATTLTWEPNSVFGNSVVSNQETNTAFSASTITVYKNGTKLVGDVSTVPSTSGPSGGADYNFSADTTGASNHTLRFSSALSAGDEVFVCYYSNTAIIDAIEAPSVLSFTTSTVGFYDDNNVPPSLIIDSDLITVSTSSGRGFIGLEHKHLLPYARSNPPANIAALALGNIIISSVPLGIANTNVDVSGSSNLTTLIDTFNSANTFLRMEQDYNDDLYIILKEEYDTVTDVTFRLIQDSANTVDLLNFTSDSMATYSRGANSVKGKLEKWLNDILLDANTNLVTSVTLANTLTTNIVLVSNIVEDPTMYQVDAGDIEGTELVHDTREEAQAFNQVVNGVYLGANSQLRSGIVNIKTNLEVATALTLAQVPLVQTLTNLNQHTVSTGTNQVTGFSLDTAVYNNFVLDYTVHRTAATDFHRMGTMMISARPDMPSGANVVFLDTSSEITNGMSGTVTFSAELDSGNAVILMANNTLGNSVTLSYSVRRWAAG